MTLTKLRARVKYWQKNLPHLGLAHWEIFVTEEEAPGGNEDSCAAVNPSSYYDSATMEFSPEWAEWTQEYLDRTIVHELLHIFFRDMNNAIHVNSHQMSIDAGSAFRSTVNHEVEGVIERLARSLVASHKK